MECEKGDKIDTHATFCPLCSKPLGIRGRYNHYMFHVRRGELTVENDPVTAEFLRMGISATVAEYARLPPYIFRLAKDD
jgi:hypothetical protein